MAEKLTVVVLVDALGWGVARHFGFCKDIFERRGPLETVLGYSSAAICSLLTGKLPQEHGVWAMYRCAPQSSPFRYLRYLPELPHPLERRLRFWLRRTIGRRKLIKGYYDLYEVPLKFLGYFDVSQKEDPYLPGSTACKTLFDEMAVKKIPYRVWTYRKPERENCEDLLSSIGGRDRFFFFYTAELDALMHRLGTEHPEVGKKLRAYEEFFESILKEASRAGRQVYFYVFSDHGMTDVESALDLWGIIKKNGCRLGRDYLAFYDSTMARFWFHGKESGKIIGLLEGVEFGRILSDAELTRWGCFFEDRSYGEVIFLLRPGVTIVPSFMAKEKTRAMHGYDPGDERSKACFLTNDPDCVIPSSILDLKSLILSGIQGDY